jgi:hypothetical protein
MTNSILINFKFLFIYSNFKILARIYVGSESSLKEKNYKMFKKGNKIRLKQYIIVRKILEILKNIVLIN